MGLSSSKQTQNTNQTQSANTTSSQQQQTQNTQQNTQSTGYSDWAQPHIDKALGSVTSAFEGNRDNIAGISGTIGGLLPSLLDKYKTGSDYSGVSDYYSDIMNGGGSNPYLEQMIAQTNQSVGDGVNAMIGSRGGAGGSAQTALLARKLAENETGLRYSDFTTQQGRRDSAAGSLASIIGMQNQSDTNNLSSLLAAANSAATLPMTGVTDYASTLAALLGKATTSTGTATGTATGSSSGVSDTSGTSTGTATSKTSGGMLGSLLGAGLAGWASGGFAL